MSKLFFLFSLLLLGFGCTSTDSSLQPAIDEPTEQEAVVTHPLDLNGAVGYNPTYKRFGEQFADRFNGYHTGEDMEVLPEDLAPDETQLVPVYAIADGVVTYHQWTSGYGGVIVLSHEIDGEVLSSLYGHLDLGSSTLAVGQTVTRGQFLANLGADASEQTDGERQHLHFGLWSGVEVKLAGYVSTTSQLSGWINPYDFFVEYGLVDPDEELLIASDTLTYTKGGFEGLSFQVPYGWDVEYVPSIDSLNLYTAFGEGSARERSQVFIRYFDASDFLTLASVNIYGTEDLTVGAQDYTARRYDITKKAGYADFADQPSWRNERHIVTDFRATDGPTRYYVVAANPDLDLAVYEAILESMRID